MVPNMYASGGAKRECQTRHIVEGGPGHRRTNAGQATSGRPGGIAWPCLSPYPRGMSEGAILAIDAGTTGVTSLLVDQRGRVVARGYRELTQHYPQPGWVE